MKISITGGKTLKNARKFFALLCTMAMVMSLFSGIVLAADVASIAYKTGASTVTGLASTMVVQMQFDAATKVIAVDLGATGHSFGTLPATVGTNWAKDATNSTATKAVYTHATGLLTDTIELPIVNGAATSNYGGTTVKGSATDFASLGSAVALLGGTNMVVTAAPALPVFTMEANADDLKLVSGKAANIRVTMRDALGAIAPSSSVWKYEIKDPSLVAPNDVVAQGQLTGGLLNIPVTLNLPEANGIYTKVQGNYNLVITKVDSSATVNLYPTSSNAVVVQHDLQVNDLGGLNKGEVAVVSGKLVNGLGYPVKSAWVELYSGATLLASTRVSDYDGSFAMHYAFSSAGRYLLKVGITGQAAVQYKDLDVRFGDALALSLIKSPEHTQDPYQKIKYSIALDKAPVSPDLLTLFSGTTQVAGTVSLVAAESSSTKNVYEFTPTTALGVGEYTLTAKHTLLGGTTYAYVKEVKFVVSTAKSGLSLNPGAGANLDGSDLYPQAALTRLDIRVYDKNGSATVVPTATSSTPDALKKVTYTVTGPFAGGEINYDSEVDGQQAGFHNVELEQAGEIAVTAKVTYGSGTQETFTKKLTVNGWVVTTEKSLGAIGDGDVTLTAKVTTTSGTPVANAIVTWTSPSPSFRVKNADAVSGYNGASVSTNRNGATTNIVDGTYSRTVRLVEASDNVTILVTTQGGATRAVFKGSIDGNPVYTVTTDKTSLVAGVAQDINVKVTDADGKTVKPEAISIKSSLAIGKFADQSITDGQWVDTNADGVNDSFRFTITPLKPETFSIKVSTHAGRNFGKTDVTVAKPTVTVTPDDGMVTASVKEAFSVALNDNVTNGGWVRLSVIGGSAKVYLPSNAMAVKEITPGDPYAFTTRSATHNFEILAVDDENNKIENPEIKIEVAYGSNAGGSLIYTEVARLAITPAVIEVNKEEITGGMATPVIVTVKDVHGNVLANKTVQAAGVAATSGVTDNDGKTTIVLNAVSTGNVKFTVNGLQGAEKTIKANADETKPEIDVTAPERTTANSVIVKGKVTDNVKVTEIYVNGAKVLFVPGAEATINAKVALEIGVNNIEIYAFDAAGNANTKTITVVRAMPTVVKLALGAADATIDGAPAAVAAPYLKGNSTMVPFRFIGEALGAYVEYADVAGTQTVTFSLDGINVVLTIGSTTAMVNGEAVAMPVAPEINNSRTMVPLRFISEALGAYVEYNPANGGITVTR